jgi:hypothetical protein
VILFDTSLSLLPNTNCWWVLALGGCTSAAFLWFFDIAFEIKCCGCGSQADGIVLAYVNLAMVTMGGDLQPGCLADQLLTGLGQPQINP